MKFVLRCVARALGDAFRLSFFRDVPAERMAPSWAGIFAAAFATIALPIVVSLWQVGWAGQWGWFSLPFVLLHLPLALAAAIAAAYALGRPADVPRLLYAALLVSLAVDIVTLAAGLAVPQSPKLYRALYGLTFLPAAWVALAFAAYACRSVERGLRRLGVVAASLVLLALPLGVLYRDRTLWHPPYTEEAQARGSRAGVADEEAFYEQPRVLERELNAVQPGRKGVIDVFFVGVAGYGSQDVFMREVDSVARLFRERFGTEGHTIRLVNNPKTALDTPIASTTSLREALRRVAAVMDVDEDVLVLFLTSHGSEDHRFSLDLWPLRLRSLTPAALRVALDESGIRNRVVVVSACYSGGFVDALRDDNTLVITAAAGDRNSFGCTNEAQWTYFGRAYFDEALRKTHSFAKAFEMAKPVIAEREKKENYDPSEPQMSMGAAIAAKLAKLEWQLESDEGAHEMPASTPQQAAATTAPQQVAAQTKVDRYVEAIYSVESAREGYKTCRELMRGSSPAAWLEREPDTFGDLDKSSPHWPRLAQAWERHAEEYCSRSNELKLLRSTFAEQVRARMGEPEIDAFLRFIATPPGARWLEASDDVQNRHMTALGKVQDKLQAASYRKYLDEQSRIYADMRKDAQAKSPKTGR